MLIDSKNIIIQSFSVTAKKKTSTSRMFIEIERIDGSNGRHYFEYCSYAFERSGMSSDPVDVIDFQQTAGAGQ